VYKWTCFGLHTLMKRCYRGELAKIPRQEKPSQYATEFLCVAERAMAFAVGGNPRVLSNDLMRPLSISRGIIDHGMPTFKPIYGSSATVSLSNPLVFRTHEWPLAKDKKYPAMASKRGQILTYGEPHYLVSTPLSSCCPIPYIRVDTWIALPRHR
jgi:hypothetical protein